MSNCLEQAVESRQLRKIEIARRGGLEASKGDRPSERTTFVALTDHIAKYMASKEFSRETCESEQHKVPGAKKCLEDTTMHGCSTLHGLGREGI